MVSCKDTREIYWGGNWEKDVNSHVDSRLLLILELEEWMKTKSWVKFMGNCHQSIDENQNPFRKPAKVLSSGL
jgi:hypothetical protein